MSHPKTILSILFCMILVWISCDHNTPITTETVIDPIDSYLLKAKDSAKTIEEKKQYLDSAYAIYTTLEDNKFKKEKINEISVVYSRLKEDSISESLDKEMLYLSIKIKDSLGIAMSYSNLGISFRKKQILDSAYYYFYKADKLYKKFEKNKNIDPLEYAFDYGATLTDLAKLSRKVKDYNESEALTIQALKKFELSGDSTYIPLSYNNLGIVAKRSGRYEDAIKYYKKSIEYSKNTSKESLYINISYNNIGTVYKSQEKYNKAIEYYTTALIYQDFLTNNPTRLARLIDNLGYAKFLANKDNDSSLYLFNKAYRIRGSIKDVVGLSTNYLHLSEYYQSKSNYSLSQEFAVKAKQAATKIGDNIELLEAYQLLAQVSPPEEGRQYAMEYIKLSDSLTKRNNFFKDKFARIRYESDTLQKENEEKNSQITKVKNQNTIYLLGILLLCTLIGFVIYFARQRTKYLAQQNKIVEFQTAYETETRISKRLHDELGNDIFQAMLQYQQNPEDPQILEKLNISYQKARDISRENNDFEIDSTFPEELRDMLQNYAQQHIRLIQRGLENIHWEGTENTVKITTYRVLQELMTNMQKHSQADLAAIVFKNGDKHLHIQYSDNGVGISEKQLLSKNGLRNTEKRLQAIGGSIHFNSQKDKGFKAEIKIPV